MQNSTVKYGIVGAGNIASVHADALSEAQNSTFTAIYDQNLERGKAFSAKYGVKYCSSFDSLLSNCNIDVVSIATPSGVHADIAIPAAKAGKHVLCEKPLEITLEKAESIIQACRQNNVLLSTIYQLRFSPDIQKIKQGLSTGLFGKIIQISAQIKWYRSREYYNSAKWRGSWRMAGGGALMTQGIHDLDLLLFLNGEPDEVFAFSNNLTHSEINVEDNAIVAVRWKNGSLGTIEASTSCNPPFPRRLEINGERGSVIAEDNKIIRWSLAKEVSEKISVFENKCSKRDGHCAQIENLSWAILNNEPVEISGEEGLHSLHFIHGIYESAASGKVFKFK